MVCTWTVIRASSFICSVGFEADPIPVILLFTLPGVLMLLARTLKLSPPFRILGSPVMASLLAMSPLASFEQKTSLGWFMFLHAVELPTVLFCIASAQEVAASDLCLQEHQSYKTELPRQMHLSTEYVGQVVDHLQV